jgi:hypothetical protein
VCAVFGYLVLSNEGKQKLLSGIFFIMELRTFSAVAMFVQRQREHAPRRSSLAFSTAQERETAPSANYFFAYGLGHGFIQHEFHESWVGFRSIPIS